MYTSAPGSTQRQMEYLEEWLVTLVQQTKRTNELLEGQARPNARGEQREDWRIEKMGKRLEQAIGSQLSSRLSQAQSIANRGFSGTVEQARMDYAMEQLGRQFAAVMKPVMDALTYGAAQIEMRMRRMSGSDQNSLLGMGLGAFAGRMMLGGLPGMLLGGAMGSAAMGGGSGDGALIGAGAGAMVGARAFGGRLGLPGAIAAGLAGAISSTPTSYEGERPSDYYSRLRGSGSTRLGAAFGTASESLSRLFSSGAPGSPPTGGGGGARRDVTPFQSDMMDAGGTYFAIQKAMIRATAGADFEEDNALKPIIDAMITMIELLGKIAGVSFTDPASVTSTRSMEGGVSGAMSVRRAP